MDLLFKTLDLRPGISARFVRVLEAVADDWLLKVLDETTAQRVLALFGFMSGHMTCGKDGVMSLDPKAQCAFIEISMLLKPVINRCVDANLDEASKEDMLTADVIAAFTIVRSEICFRIIENGFALAKLRALNTAREAHA